MKYSSSLSIKIAEKPSQAAASPVVPVPAKGSSINPPFGVINLQRYCINLTGFKVGINTIMIINCKECNREFSRRGKNAHKAKFCSILCKSKASGTKEKQCIVCSKTFVSIGQRSKNSKYCSLACKGIDSRLLDKQCNYCKRLYKPIAGRFNSSLYCSKDCSNKGRIKGKEVFCEWCKVPIYTFSCHLKSHKTHFCCVKHHNNYQARNKKSFICKICNSIFYVSAAAVKQKNRVYCSQQCRDADPIQYDRLIKMNMKQASQNINKLESFGYKMLSDMNISFQSQYLIGKKFLVDAFLNEYKLIIQFDGDYWHGNPLKYPNPSKQQLKRITLDKSQDKYMIACGYTVFRIWENDLYKKTEQIKEKLKLILFTIKK